MITIDVRSDVAATIAKLGLERGKLVDKAQVRAINRTADQLGTEAGRKIRESYNVTLRGIRQAMKIKKASSGSKFPFAEVSFSGRPINLVEFGARAVNPWNVPGRKRRRGGGVSVQVLRQSPRKLIAGAFLATIKSGQNVGKKGVFRRVGKARNPIRFLPSISVPVMAERRAIKSAILEMVGRRFPVNLRDAIVSLMPR